MDVVKNIIGSKLDRKISNYMFRLGIPQSKFNWLKHRIMMDYSGESHNEDYVYKRLKKQDVAEIYDASK